MASGRPLWEGHRERLRRRMEREGWDALRPHEMVELVLYHAVPRQDLSDISRVLVDRFGSVGGVFRASREELLAVDGVTPTVSTRTRVSSNRVISSCSAGVNDTPGVCSPSRKVVSITSTGALPLIFFIDALASQVILFLKPEFKIPLSEVFFKHA